jgi:hypothetical protein
MESIPRAVALFMLTYVTEMIVMVGAIAFMAGRLYERGRR